MIQHGTNREEYLSLAIVWSGGSSVGSKLHDVEIRKVAQVDLPPGLGSCWVDVQSSGRTRHNFHRRQHARPGRRNSDCLAGRPSAKFPGLE